MTWFDCRGNDGKPMENMDEAAARLAGRKAWEFKPEMFHWRIVKIELCEPVAPAVVPNLPG